MLREAAGELERLLTGGAAVPGDAAGVYEPGNTEPGDRNGVRGSVEKEAEDTEGSCGPAKKRLAGGPGPDRGEDRNGLPGCGTGAEAPGLDRRGLGLSGAPCHGADGAPRDGELRNLHVMEG